MSARDSIETHFNQLISALQNRKNELLQVADGGLKNKDNVSFVVASPDSLLQTIKSLGIVDIQKAIKTTAKAVTTLAGSTQGNSDGSGSNAKFNTPSGIVLNSNDDCLYFCDFNNDVIRKVSKSGEVVKFVDIAKPHGIAYYQKDNCFFVSEIQTHSIKRISATGEISTVAGSGQAGYEDGPGAQAKFNYPFYISLDQQTGEIYVSDCYSHIIRKIDAQGEVTTFAGTKGKVGTTDGDRKSSLFFNPYGIFFDNQTQSLLICDRNNNSLRRISSNGQVSTICPFVSPRCVYLLPGGDLIISSSVYKVFKVLLSDNNKIEVFVGSGERGEKDGSPLESQFSTPEGIAIDTKNNLIYVTDYFYHKIRVIQYE